MEREIANVMKASGLRSFRYRAFPPVVFEVVPRLPEVEVEVEAEALAPGMAVRDEPVALVAPEVAVPPPVPARAVADSAPAAPVVAVPQAPVVPVAMPQPIPDPPAQAWMPAPARPPAGLRLLAEAAAAAAPAPSRPVTPKPADPSRRFALLEDISTEMRPRRARTGRRQTENPS